MPLVIEILEQAKEALGFDEYVSGVIAQSYKQGTRVSIALLTQEVRLRFNYHKMRELGGEDASPKSPVSSMWNNKYVYCGMGHDGIASKCKDVMIEYCRLVNDSGASRKTIRANATRLQVALVTAVRSTPLKDVSAFRDRM